MKLKPLALGLATGITLGLVVMIVTWWLMILGSEGGLMGKLSIVYIGYSVSFVGSLIGLVWGFIDGLIGGWLVATLYNALNKG